MTLSLYGKTYKGNLKKKVTFLFLKGSKRQGNCRIFLALYQKN